MRLGKVARTGMKNPCKTSKRKQQRNLGGSEQQLEEGTVLGNHTWRAVKRK